jgi:hypothetical protein
MKFDVNICYCRLACNFAFHILNNNRLMHEILWLKQPTSIWQMYAEFLFKCLRSLGLKNFEVIQWTEVIIK